MGRDSAIEWTEHTFNPWWGCQKVSPGCEHCYAEGIANRFGNNIWGPPHATDRRLFGDKHWDEPLRWNARAGEAGTPARVFVASMADVFEDHPQVADERERMWGLIARTPWLVWMLLTKRPENVAGMVPWDCDPRIHMRKHARVAGNGWPANVWIGTSVEDQGRAHLRIPELLALPAPVRFVSAEPLLGPVDLAGWWLSPDHCCGDCHVFPAPENWPCICDCHEQGKLDWLIVGGESGPGARPMQPQWARQLRDHALLYRIPFLFKQWGAWAPEDVLIDAGYDGGYHFEAQGETAGLVMARPTAGKKATGRQLDGRTHDDHPPLPEPAHG